jgi:hypothetical protein
MGVFNVSEEIFRIRKLTWGPPWVFCLVVRIVDGCFQNNFGAALFLVASGVQLLLVLGLDYILSRCYLL